MAMRATTTWRMASHLPVDTPADQSSGEGTSRFPDHDHAREPPAEAERNQKDPQLRKRCCYRDKAKGKPPLRAKACVVAHGHLDPDTRSLSRNTATPTRMSEMLLWRSTSALHGMAFRTADKWMLWARLFMKPRQDEIRQLSQIIGNVYALCSHGLRKSRDGFWSLALSGTPLTGCASNASNDGSFAPCALLICYVDDFLLPYTPGSPLTSSSRSSSGGRTGTSSPTSPSCSRESRSTW